MNLPTKTLLVLLTMARCQSRQPLPAERPSPQEARIAAANLFTRRYASSRLSSWHVHAAASGGDCAVLLVEMPAITEDSTIEAIHYGAGSYDVYDGGIQRFYRQKTFRGVAYKDISGRLWTYG